MTLDDIIRCKELFIAMSGKTKNLLLIIHPKDETVLIKIIEDYCKAKDIMTVTNIAGMEVRLDADLTKPDDPLIVTERIYQRMKALSKDITVRLGDIEFDVDKQNFHRYFVMVINAEEIEKRIWNPLTTVIGTKEFYQGQG